MVDHINFISLREVLARVARHPMIQDIDLEAGVQYTLDFFGIIGLPDITESKQAEVCIKDYRGLLPCDVVRINMVRNEHTGLCMRSMTDYFNGHSGNINSEDTFKTQGEYIFTSFEKGLVRISYESIKLDDDGIPMLPNHAAFLQALEDYIKVKKFTILFDCGKIRGDVLQHAENAYMRSSGKCINVFSIPSKSEMQTLTSMMHRLIPSRNEFRKGFKTLGDKEFYKIH